MSRLAGTANLRIVPFIRLAPTHNKTPLTRSLKNAARTQCDWVLIAFEWALTNALIYFLLLLSLCLVFFYSSSSKYDPWAVVGWMFTRPVKLTHLFTSLADKQHFNKL